MYVAPLCVNNEIVVTREFTTERRLPSGGRKKCSKLIYRSLGSDMLLQGEMGEFIRRRIVVGSRMAGKAKVSETAASWYVHVICAQITLPRNVDAQTGNVVSMGL